MQHPGSAQTYASKLRRHVLPAFGAKRLSELSRWDVQRFLTEKQRHGYSVAHVRGMRAAISKVLQAAVGWGYLDENPAYSCRIAGRQPALERQHLEPGQIQRLASALPEPCRTLVLTGLRIGELATLRWKRVDLLQGAIVVAETFSDGRFGQPKSRSSNRIVPMSEAVQQALLAHRSRSERTGPDDLVFSSRKGTPVNPKNLLRRVLHPTCKRLGLPPVTWHSFRHTHTTWLSAVGASPRTAQAILGHSSVEMTLGVYTHAVPEAQREAEEKLGAILDLNGPKLAASEQEHQRLVQ